MHQYVFKKSDKSIWNVYYDDRNNNILIRPYNKRRAIWYEPVINIKNAGPQISCDMDSEDNIHITFTGKKGDIYYGCYDGSTIRPFPVLVGKNPTTYDKNLSVCACKQSVYIFYTVHHNDKVILTMQEIFPEKSLAGDPAALDYVSENKSPYKIISTPKYLYIIYNKALNPPSKNPADFTLGVKVYSPDDKKVVSFVEIPLGYNDIESINSCFIDNDDTLVIFASTPKGLKEIRAYEFVKNTADILDTVSTYPGKTDVTEPDGVHDLNDCFYSGLQISNTKYVYYCGASNLYIYKSPNRKTYEPAEKIPLSNGRLFSPIYYKSNYSNESPYLENFLGKFMAPLPGKISGSPFCYIFNPFADHEPKAAELGNALLESLNLIKSEISRLDSMISEQNKKISEIEASILKLERELIKLDIKLKNESLSK